MATALPSGRNVDVTVDGASMRLPEGAMLASALMVAGLRKLRESPRDRAPRGAFCFTGACQECTILIDGTLRQACMTPVSAGMAIELRGAS